MLTRRAAVVGSPISHSLSPVLHGAAYAALGLAGWSYDRVEVPRGGLAGHVGGLGPEWVGLSVTMPGKEEALALADEVSEEAALAGAANTLVRTGTGWYADNTDIYGLATALAQVRAEGTQDGAGGAAGRPGAAGPGEQPRRGLVLGGGATARSAVLALRRLGVTEVTLLVRDRPRPETEDLVGRLRTGTTDPLEVRVGALADGIPLDREETDLVVGTLPATAPAPPLRWAGGAAPVVLDVTYAPWPSPLARAVDAATGGRVAVVRGTSMLLHQAARQVELMTGSRPPVAAMERALAAHLAGEQG